MQHEAGGAVVPFPRPALGSVAVAVTAVGMLALLARFGPAMADLGDRGNALPGRAVGYVLLGLAWLTAGGIEWLRGNRRTGAELLAVAGVVALGSMIASRSPWAHTIGGLVTNLGAPLVAYILTTYPEAPLRRGDRWPIVLAAIGAASGLPLHLFYAPHLYWCPACPADLNPIFWRTDEVALTAILAVGGAAIVASLVGVAVTAVRRYRRAGPVARRVVGPVSAAAFVYVAGTFLFLVDQNADLSDLGPLHSKDGLGAVAFLAAAIVVPLALLFARARERSLAAHLHDLALPVEEQDFETSLQRLVGDPDLRVGYATPDGGLRGVDGRSLAVPEPGDPSRAVTSLGDGVGVLVHDRALLRERSLLDPLVVVTGLAVRNQMLAQEVSARLEEVRASRTRLVEVADAARRQVERDLHDGAQQRLVTMAVRLRMLEAEIAAGEDAGSVRLAQEMAQVSEELQSALGELRDLARGLFPSALRSGLRPALDALLGRAPDVEWELRVDRRLPPAVESAAYFVVAEALTNARRHARCAARVRVVDDGDALCVVVEDDGQGGADPSGGGLSGLADRVAALNGTFQVTSPPGCGTTVAVQLPLPRPIGGAPIRATGFSETSGASGEQGGP